MSANRWPRVFGPVDCFGGTATEYVPGPEGLRRGDTACKHGKSECIICGTTEHRDTKHTTVNGKGKVGSIPR